MEPRMTAMRIAEVHTLGELITALQKFEVENGSGVVVSGERGTLLLNVDGQYAPCYVDFTVNVNSGVRKRKPR